MDRSEQALGKVVEVAAPGLGIVAVRVDVPQVGNLLGFEKAVHALRHVEQSVLVAAGDEQQPELGARGRRVGQQLLGWQPVGRGREAASPNSPNTTGNRPAARTVALQ